MKIKITGASGYLGLAITNELKTQGHDVSGIERKLIYGSIKNLSKEIESADVIINLAGAPILQRWTKRKKLLIHESRVRTTTNIIKAINDLPIEKQPARFISASAVGIYKTGLTHDETSTDFDTGFVGMVAKDWEDASAGLTPNVQKIIMRIGLVLGYESKIISYAKTPFKLALGATIGNGKQSFPYIHEKDLVNAFVWAISGLAKHTVYNLVAPEKITNRDFTEAFAKTLNRPAVFFIPEFAVKIALGEAAVLLTESPVVEPGNLTDAGFRFKYPDIWSTLKDLLKTEK